MTHTMIFDIFIFTYGAYSSAVERQIVDLVVVGSIPTRHPFLFNAIVAHLDRATDFESVGSTFESCQSQPRGLSAAPVTPRLEVEAALRLRIRVGSNPVCPIFISHFLLLLSSLNSV